MADDESRPVEDSATTTVEQKKESDWFGIGVPNWFYLVILDALVLLLLVIWVVTQNEHNLDEYLSATNWALQILAYLYLAVALFGMARTAMRGEELNVVGWGMMLIVALMIIGIHWVGIAAIGLITIAHMFCARRTPA